MDNQDRRLEYVLAGKRYVNLKKGTTYQVFQFGQHTETAEGFIVYVLVDRFLGFQHRLGLFFMGLASHLLRDRVWVRPIELFEEKFREE